MFEFQKKGKENVKQLVDSFEASERGTREKKEQGIFTSSFICVKARTWEANQIFSLRNYFLRRIMVIAFFNSILENFYGNLFF